MTRLAKFRKRDGTVAVGSLDGDAVRVLDAASLSDLLHAGGAAAAAAIDTVPIADVTPLAPVDRQEIWAAGVTYLRSKQAREEESEGAAVFYDKVYDAPRPELFFKATAGRVVHPGDPVAVRADSRWSVPEPELALVVSPAGKVVGHTIGNDMSARDIEGENPLYLPQAKVYRRSCAVGPAVSLATDTPAEQIRIDLRIDRGGSRVYEGHTDFGRLKRSPEELVEWLFRDNDFPDGVILLTGTGLVPPDDFTLQAGDVIEIEVAGVGVLRNPVS